MSTPKNHHYISQTHIKKFFDKNINQIFVYNKEHNFLTSKNSSKKIFSEENLNTMITKNGFDYNSVEDHFNLHFENDFNHYYKEIENYLKSDNINESLKKSLIFFAKYGAIGNTRTPYFKKELDEAFFNALHPYFESSGTDDQKREFYKNTQPYGDKKYSNFPNSLEIAENILKRMGKLNFIIMVPESNDDYFILPDFCSITLREKINVYFNPDIQEISIIGFPLSSNIYIEFYSENSQHNPKVSGILKISSDQVEKVNKTSILLAHKIVVCQSKNYLEKLVKKTFT